MSQLNADAYLENAVANRVEDYWMDDGPDPDPERAMMSPLQYEGCPAGGMHTWISLDSYSDEGGYTPGHIWCSKCNKISAERCSDMVHLHDWTDLGVTYEQIVAASDRMALREMLHRATNIGLVRRGIEEQGQGTLDPDQMAEQYALRFGFGVVAVWDQKYYPQRPTCQYYTRIEALNQLIFTLCSELECDTFEIRVYERFCQDGKRDTRLATRWQFSHDAQNVNAWFRQIR